MKRHSKHSVAVVVVMLACLAGAHAQVGSQAGTRRIGRSPTTSGANPQSNRTVSPAQLFKICGGAGQACCVDPGNPSHCGVGLGCDLASNRCVAPCGGNGQACCSGPDSYAGFGNKNPTSPMYCANDAVGELVCSPRKQMCSSGSCDISTQRCLACGQKAGDACCPPDAQQATSSCKQKTLLCQTANPFQAGGTCINCGQLNGPPCPGDECSAGLSVDHGVCVACGKIGQPTCDGSCHEGGPDDAGLRCVAHYRRPVPAARKCSTMPTGLILREWMRLGGPNGPMGCPTWSSPNYFQFENGAVATAPDIWPRGVWGAYQVYEHFMIDWTTAFYDEDAKNYDKFLLHWDDGQGTSAGVDILQKIENLPINADAHAIVKYEQCTDGGCTRDTHLRKNGTYAQHFKSMDNQQGGSPRQPSTTTYTLDIEGCDFGFLNQSKCDGWLPPLRVQYRWPPPDIGMFNWADFSKIKPATTVEGSIATFDDRLAAIILKRACQPLEYSMYRHEEGMEVLIAKLAYADYFRSDYCPGKDIPNRVEANAWIMKQTPQSHTGTTIDDHIPFRTGEYEVALMHLMPIIYKLRHALTNDAAEHIVTVLLNTSGPLDTSDFSVAMVSPETENHINMIETARFLTNQILFTRTHQAQYDNRANGLAAWWLQRLQVFLRRDFVEYNSRPYTGYTTSALQNLYSFSFDPQVKAAAGMVLDYLSAKTAVSSINGRRSVPFRRRTSHDKDDFSDNPDPNMLRMFMLAGNTEMIGDVPTTAFDQGPCGPAGSPFPCDQNWYWRDAQRELWMPWRWPAMKLPEQYLWEMLMAGISDYRVPPPILDLIVTRDHRTFYQGFRYPASSADVPVLPSTTSEPLTYAEELYASSRSYLISAGGTPTPPAYNVNAVVTRLSDKEDLGVVPPTTFIPFDAYRSREYLVRFAGNPNLGVRVNMCVAPDFACGTNVIIPRNQSDPTFFGPYGDNTIPPKPADPHFGTAECAVRVGTWMFFNHSGPICGHILPTIKTCGPSAAYKQFAGSSMLARAGQFINSPPAPSNTNQQTSSASRAATSPPAPYNTKQQTAMASRAVKATNQGFSAPPPPPNVFLDCPLPGYYLAVYQYGAGTDSFGVLEAYDTFVPGHDLTFDEFKTQVQKNNPHPFNRNNDTYVTATGRHIGFSIAQGRVLSGDPGIQPPSQPMFLWGDVMNSSAGSGTITLFNPYTHQQATMDDHTGTPSYTAWHVLAAGPSVGGVRKAVPATQTKITRPLTSNNPKPTPRVNQTPKPK